jgi:DNA polymerase-3 subunit epsilon
MSLFSSRKSVPENASEAPEINRYRNLTQAINSKSISDTLVVFDTETTGLDVRKDKMLSIGAIKIHKNTLMVDTCFSSYIHQPGYNGEAAEVHGISPDLLKHAPPETGVLLKWLDFVQGSTLVGHHVSFDRSMVDQALQRHYGENFVNNALDTVDLTRHADDTFSPHKTLPGNRLGLDYLCKHYNIPIEDRHTALGDAYMTGLLYLRLRALAPGLDLARLLK